MPKKHAGPLFFTCFFPNPFCKSKKKPKMCLTSRSSTEILFSLVTVNFLLVGVKLKSQLNSAKLKLEIGALRGENEGLQKKNDEVVRQLNDLDNQIQVGFHFKVSRSVFVLSRCLNPAA